MDKELEILRKYFSPLAKNKESLGLRNDAAFLDLKKKMVVSTDMMVEGQNDYSLGEAVQEMGGKTYHVKDWTDTRTILEGIQH